MNFNESQTKQNLAKSFAAECQAGARYQFMATQAQTEGLVFVKDTLKMIAKNEMAHAKLFYDYVLENCGEVCEVNIEADYAYICPALKTSLEEEAQVEESEAESIYPEFARIADKEGFSDIAESFRVVAKVEDTHAGILNRINNLYKNKSMYKRDKKDLFKCSNCGHLAYLAEGWKKCPLCSLPEGYIELSFVDIFKNALGVSEN